MTTLVWDQVGERRYETGIDKGVLYPVEDDGSYGEGVGDAEVKKGRVLPLMQKWACRATIFLLYFCKSNAPVA